MNYLFKSLYVGKKWHVLYTQIRKEAKRTKTPISDVIWQRVLFSKEYNGLYATWLNKHAQKDNKKGNSKKT